MWTIWEHRKIARRMQRLPVEVAKRYQKWKDIVDVNPHDYTKR